jgi:hypothetical protein
MLNTFANLMVSALRRLQTSSYCASSVARATTALITVQKDVRLTVYKG